MAWPSKESLNFYTSNNEDRKKSDVDPSDSYSIPKRMSLHALMLCISLFTNKYDISFSKKKVVENEEGVICFTVLLVAPWIIDGAFWAD